MEYRPYYLARDWVRLGHHVQIVASAQSHIRAQQPQLMGQSRLDETIAGIHYNWFDTPKYRSNGIWRAQYGLLCSSLRCRWHTTGTIRQTGCGNRFQHISDGHVARTPYCETGRGEHRCHGDGQTWWDCAWRCYKTTQKLDADLYHFHDPELIPYGVLLAGPKKKMILYAHEDLRGDIYSKHWIPLPARRVVAAISRALEHLGARLLSAVVAAMAFIGTLFERIADCMSVINNYPLLGDLIPLNAGGTAQRDSACYVGGINEIRGIKEIVQAVAAADCNLLRTGCVMKSCNMRDGPM